jgi:GNAT superfamily N-acetyltransferase
VSTQLGPARRGDEREIVERIREGFAPGLLDLFVYGCPGMAAFVSSQIAAGPRCDTQYFVARSPSGLAGVVEFRLLPKQLFLNYIAIGASQRSSGLGRRLLLAATRAHARPTQEEMGLDVLEGNHVARGWYERVGFTARATTEWWSVITSHAGAPAPEVSWLLRQCAQADASHDHFGFSQFVLDNGDLAFSVGRLGSRWFRITDASALREDVLRVLHEIDPRRQVLALLPAGVPIPPFLTTRLVTRTVRMTASVPRVTEGLQRGEA